MLSLRVRVRVSLECDFCQPSALLALNQKTAPLNTHLFFDNVLMDVEEIFTEYQKVI